MNSVPRASRPQAVDIVDRDAVDAAMRDVVSQLGTPTILVNNAGLGSSPVGAALENGPFEDYPKRRGTR